MARDGGPVGGDGSNGRNDVPGAMVNDVPTPVRDGGSEVLREPPALPMYSGGACPMLVSGATEAISRNNGFRSGAQTRSFHVMGQLSCWGSGERSSLGLPNDRLPYCGSISLGSPTPIRINLPGPVRRIAPSQRSVCAVLEDGTVWCWGTPQFSPPAGDGSPAAPPVHEPGMDRFVSFGGYFGVACGIDADGVAWIWGRSTSLLGSAEANDDRWHGEPFRLRDPIE